MSVRSCSGCCSPTCDIGSDTFPTNGSGAPSGWTLRTGGVDVAFGYLEFTTSDSIVLFNTAHPDGLASAIVTVDIVFGDAEQMIIIFDHDGSDDDNFYYVQIEPYFLSLCRMNAGTPQVLKCVACDATANPSVVNAWFDGETSGTFAAAVDNPAYQVYYNVGTGHTGDRIGLGCRTIIAAGDFDNFVVEKYKQSGNSCDDYTPVPCDIGEDDFNRVDDADPGCPWDELAGTSAITSNKLSFTAANSRAQFVHGAEDGAMSVRVRFAGANTGDVVEIGVGANSGATAMHYARLEIGANKPLILGTLAGGTITSKTGVDTSAGVEYTIDVTLANGRLCASMTDQTPDLQFVSTAVTLPSGTVYATLGCRTVTSAVTFDNFEMFQGRTVDHQCAECGASGPTCDTCCPDQATLSAFVDIAGSLTDIATCSYCSAASGEFEAVRESDCVWHYCQYESSDAVACLLNAACADGTVCTDLTNCSGLGDATACGGCKGVDFRVTIAVEADNTCSITVIFAITHRYTVSGGGCLFAGILAYGVYRYTGDPIDPCNGDSYTVTLDTTECYGKPGCSGTLPTTLSVRFA